MCLQLRAAWPLLFFALFASALPAQTSIDTFTWTGAATNEDGSASLTNENNWTGFSPPKSPADSTSPPALIFSSIATGASSTVRINESLEVYSLTFSGSYPSYSFSSYGESSLRVGAGGITVGSRETEEVTFDLLALTANQTWNVGSGGLLSVDRVTGSYGITKTGTGELALTQSSFTGGLDVQAGKLSASYDGSSLSNSISIGTGAITLRSGTFLAGDSDYSIELNNALLLESGVTFGASFTAALKLKGSTTLQSASTILTVQGDNPTYFDGVVGEANSGTSLTVRGSRAAFLNGTNTYTGATIADGGLVIFGNSSAFGSTSSVNAINNGYVGVTYSGGMATLISKTTPSSYTGTLGFDSTSETATFTDNVNLANFESAKLVGLGTATSAVLTGTLTPPSGGTLPLVGINDGYLKVSTDLLAGTVSSVTIGYPTNSSTISYNGYVELSSANSTYMGNTTLQSGYLLVGADSTLVSANVTQGPLGRGTLVVSSSAQSPALAASTNGATLHNNIQLQGSSVLKIGIDGKSSPSISRFGENSLTLNGNISGTGSLESIGSSTLTLGGTNSFSGGVTISGYGTVVANSSSALGTGTLDVGYGTVQFNTNATTGSVEGNGNIVVNNAATLQINQQQAGTFGGYIYGSGITIAKTGSATLTIGSGCSTSSYTGTTSVNQGTLAVNGSSFSWDGTTYGPLGGSTVSVTGGQLQLAAGSSISNPITLGGGQLTLGESSSVSGNITFTAASRISGTGTIASAFTAGTNATLAPGSSPGLLSFGNGLTFGSGGTYEIEFQSADGKAGEGFDTILVAGVLDFSTPASAFKFDLISLSISGAAGNVADFSASTAYSWQIAFATGGITGFTTANTTISTTGFSNPTNNGIFSLSVTPSGDAAALFLNFTPVPEPSTWALLVSGLGLIGLMTGRRARSR